MTKEYKKKVFWLGFFSFLTTILPVLIFVILGFINGSVGQKFTLGLCVLMDGILTLINLMFKYKIRSSIWILLIGIYVCVDNIIPLLITIAISTIIDEFILEPLLKGYKAKYIINKEIDKRG